MFKECINRTESVHVLASSQLLQVFTDDTITLSMLITPGIHWRYYYTVHAIYPRYSLTILLHCPCSIPQVFTDDTITLSMLMLSFIFVIVCGIFEWTRICESFKLFSSSSLFISVLLLEIQISRGKGWVPLTVWFSRHISSVPVPCQDMDLQRHMWWPFSGILFVNIGETVGRHCSMSLFMIEIHCMIS